MAVQTHKLTNCNVYINGGSMLGQVKELELPTVTQKMTEHQALGMLSAFELPSGIDKMEMKIGWNSYYEVSLGIMANPTQVVNLQVRGSLETWDSSGRSAQRPAVCFLSGTFKELPLGTFAQHENGTIDSMLNVTAVRLEIAGSEILALDVFANIYRVNGVDIAATYRENIGQ